MSVIPRLNRLFKEDGKCFQIAVDHGLFNGYELLSGVEDIGNVLDLAVAAGVDALLMSPGQARHLQAKRAHPKPALVMRADVSNAYDTRMPDYAFNQCIDSQLEQALRLDAAAIVLNLFYCEDDPGISQHSLQNVAELRGACESYGMPLMVEPLVLESDEDRGGYRVSSAFEKVVALHRQAAEMGVHVIKSDPTDRPEDYGQLVNLVGGVPLLPRGGGKVNDREILNRTYQMLQAGASGVVYGRNIFQHPNPLRMAAAIHALVHEAASLEDALSRLEG
ncbi:MAG: aldolase [Acidobacteriota bacterium]